MKNIVFFFIYLQYCRLTELIFTRVVFGNLSTSSAKSSRLIVNSPSFECLINPMFAISQIDPPYCTVQFNVYSGSTTGGNGVCWEVGERVCVCVCGGGGGGGNWKKK